MQLFRRKPTWHERHPLPPGWRPRTRIDVAGRETEPWQYLVSDAHSYALDGGEIWLPTRLDPDEAAWTALQWWIASCAPEFLEPHEVPGVRLSVRPGAYVSNRAGIAYADEAALTAG